jgi:hypothetical protein
MNLMCLATASLFLFKISFSLLGHFHGYRGAEIFRSLLQHLLQEDLFRHQLNNSFLLLFIFFAEIEYFFCSEENSKRADALWLNPLQFSMLHRYDLRFSCSMLYHTKKEGF